MADLARRVLRSLRRRLSAATRVSPAPPAPAAAPRTDPLPASGPFPAGRYVFLVENFPRASGGRSASLVAKARLFAERAKVASVIAVMYPSGETEDIDHQLHEQGALPAGVRVVNLWDYYPDTSAASSDVVEHPVELTGMDSVVDADVRVRRYFDNGVYRLYQRFDHAGRLIVRDWFNEDRARTRRDTFYANGMLRRSVFMDLSRNLPRQEVAYRRDGTPLLNLWWQIDEWGGRSVERITAFDEAGRPTELAGGYEALIHRCLDGLLGFETDLDSDGPVQHQTPSEPVFLCVEARAVDPAVLSYRRPDVRRLFVLHSTHVQPGEAAKNLRPRYRRLFAHRSDADAIVFLTNTQRAEAETVFGRQETFRVVPHFAEVESLAGSRDPRLAVMMTRLSEEKQVGQAIDAFAGVPGVVPGARLEIFGRGPEQVALQQQIERLLLGTGVSLEGFTADPAAQYRRASLALLTSRFEGAPLMIIEAFAHGCPVLAYDLRYGPADMIIDGVNGFLIPNGDVAAMRQAIITCLNDPELLARLSVGASESAANYGADASLARWAQLYRELAERPSAAGRPE